MGRRLLQLHQSITTKKKTTNKYEIETLNFFHPIKKREIILTNDVALLTKENQSRGLASYSCQNVVNFFQYFFLSLLIHFQPLPVYFQYLLFGSSNASHVLFVSLSLQPLFFHR